MYNSFEEASKEVAKGVGFSEVVGQDGEKAVAIIFGTHAEQYTPHMVLSIELVDNIIESLSQFRPTMTWSDGPLTTEERTVLDTDGGVSIQ